MHGVNVSKESVRILHKQIKNGLLNNQNMSKLVNILGGIDDILADYLSESSNTSVTQPQLQQITHLLQSCLSQGQSPKQQHILTHDKHKTEDNNCHSSDVIYYFNEDDTCLNDIMSADKVDTLLSVLYSKIIRFVVIICLLSHSVMTLIANIGVNINSDSFFNRIHWIPYIITISMSCICTIPWLLFAILSSNKKALWFILQTFEFWFKVVNGCIMLFAVSISLFYVHLSTRFVIFIGITQVLILQIIILISALDALNVKRKWKIMFSVLIATVFVIVAVQDLFKIYHNYSNGYQQLYDHNIWFISISLQSIIIETRRNLMIFFVKQAFLSIMRAKKDKAVLIKYSPTIKWSTQIYDSRTVEIAATEKQKDIPTSRSVSNSYAVPGVINHTINTQMQGNTLDGQHSSVSYEDEIGSIQL